MPFSFDVAYIRYETMCSWSLQKGEHMPEIIEYSGGSGGVSGGSGGSQPPLPLRPWGEQVGCCWVQYDENGKVISKTPYCLDLNTPEGQTLYQLVLAARGRPIGEWHPILVERGFPRLCDEYLHNCPNCCTCHPLFDYPQLGTVRPKGGWVLPKPMN